MTPQEKAQQLYNDAYMRWCHELSHDKNVLTAKNICIYICNEVMLEQCKSSELKDPRYQDERLMYWNEVKQEIEKL